VTRNNFGEPNLLVLASLASGPKHGYAVIVEIERHTGRRLGPGTLYGIIARLEREGLIKPLEQGERGRRPYRMTAAGKRVFEERLRSIQIYRRALSALANL
jgi:DNA-binding PadR family transcriptional regulator